MGGGVPGVVLLAHFGEVGGATRVLLTARQSDYTADWALVVIQHLYISSLAITQKNLWFVFKDTALCS